jgi:hypothetical protein
MSRSNHASGPVFGNGRDRKAVLLHEYRDGADV